MRRTIVMALLGALLLASPALAADGTQVKILRDCQDDGVLQGNYTAAQMRDARNNIPAELDEYSDCRDVLTRAISKQTASSAGANDGSGGTTAAAGGVGSSSGGSGGGGGTGSGATGGSSPTDPSATPDPGDSGHEVPTTPQEWNAINQANVSADKIVKDLKPVSPGASRLTADVGRNGLPGLLIGVLALIAAATLALFAAPVIRRRGLGPRQT